MNRFKVIKSLLMNLPVSITMSFVAQLVNIILGHMEHFEWGTMAISFLFSYVVAFFVSYFIPADRAGLAFAAKCGAAPGSWKFDMLVNLVVNTVFSIIMTFIMGWFSACLLGGAPLVAAVQGFGQMIVPVWIACYIVSLFAQRPAMRLAGKICGAPDAPQH